jgi:hypothetical protein
VVENLKVILLFKITAVKILHSQDEAATKMFFKEAALLCKLRHVNIVPSFGACVKPPNLAISSSVFPTFC